MVSEDCTATEMTSRLRSTGDPGSPAMALSIVSPVYGCAGCLEELLDRIEAVVSPLGLTYEVILVDDSSPDGAWARITELSQLHGRLKAIRLARNFGQHAAISAGLMAARGDVVVVMDCDLQDQPEEIPRLLAALGGEVKISLAERRQRQDSALKRLGSYLFYRTINWLTGVTHDHSTANFGAYARPVVDAVVAMPESNRFFPLLVKWSGFRSINVPVQHAQRVEGRSGYSFGRLMRLALDIALSYSDKPLKVMVLAGMGFSATSVGFVAYSIFKYLQGDIRVAGFTSVVASIWLVGGIMVLSVGVAGLYTGRTFMETKRRPWFVVAERLGHGSAP